MGWPCKKCGNEETSVCPNCESIEPDARIAELESAVKVLAAELVSFSRAYDEFTCHINDYVLNNPIAKAAVDAAKAANQ